MIKYKKNMKFSGKRITLHLIPFFLSRCPKKKKKKKKKKAYKTCNYLFYGQ